MIAAHEIGAPTRILGAITAPEIDVALHPGEATYFLWSRGAVLAARYGTPRVT